jgi:hypothetical protein
MPSFILLLFFSFAYIYTMHILNLLQDRLSEFVRRFNIKCFIVLYRPFLAFTLLFYALFLFFPFLKAKVKIELLLVFLY